MDFAFIFKCPKTNIQVALWAHQAILAGTSKQFRDLHLLPRKMNATLTSTRAFKISTSPVLEGTLAGYSALLRFLYTGVADPKADLREVVVTPWPVESPEQYLQLRKSNGVAEGVMKEIEAGPSRNCSWKRLSDLSVRYRLKQLNALCKVHL
ncbi:hypothetical protein BG000_007020 [Podila horticola]|nr:hypothetical protein BG000_007020 [Podila horticola]